MDTNIIYGSKFLGGVCHIFHAVFYVLIKNGRKTMKVLVTVLVKIEEAQLKTSSHTPSVGQM